WSVQGVLQESFEGRPDRPPGRRPVGRTGVERRCGGEEPGIVPRFRGKGRLVVRGGARVDRPAAVVTARVLRRERTVRPGIEPAAYRRRRDGQVVIVGVQYLDVSQGGESFAMPRRLFQ